MTSPTDGSGPVGDDSESSRDDAELARQDAGPVGDDERAERSSDGWFPLDVGGESAVEPGGGRWGLTIAHVVGVLTALTGLALVSFGVLEVLLLEGPDGPVARRWGGGLLFLVLGLGVLGLERWYQSVEDEQRRRYLDQVDIERRDLAYYRRLLRCEEWLSDARTADGGADRRRAAVENVCYQLDGAEIRLDKASAAAKRGDYATSLDMFYEANRQQILVYPYLEEPADEADGVGADADGVGGAPVGGALGPRVEADVDGVEADTVDGVPGPRVDPTAAKATGRLPPSETRGYNLAKRILSLSRESLPSNQRSLVESYLTEEEGVVKTPTTRELYSAVRVVHDYNVEQVRKVTEMKEFLQRANGLLTALLFGFAFVYAAGSLGDVTPLLGVGSDLPTGSRLTSGWFLLLVALTGALGALFSSLFPVTERFYSQTTDPKIPAPGLMAQATLARILVGAVSGLLLYVFVLSGMADEVFADDLWTKSTSLLVVAFLGGFSERILQRSLEKLESRAPS